MFNWLRKEDGVVAFWRWFEKNAAKIRIGVDAQDHEVIIRQLGEQIAKARPGVVHEIGMPDDDTVELIFSADGFWDAIPGVLALINGAPRIEGFVFTAFRPRRPAPSLIVLDQDVAGDDLHYLSSLDGDRMDLTVFVPGDGDDRARATIGFLMLDQALGEYDVMTGLGRIDFVGEPLEGAKPLTALAEEFDAFRAQTAH